MPKTLFFSVGEPSGDQHAARLIEAVQAIDPETRIRGFGGPAMAAAGARLDLDLTGHAVVGILEVLPKIRQFFAFARQAEDIFERGSVDGVVLVDFPGFNWHIAKRARRNGIPVYYYCPPQLWAWGGWRIGKLKRSVDHVLAVLPVEQEYFAAHGVPCTYVGHPFFDAVQSTPLDALLLRRLETQRSRGDQLVAVLPGSRGHEVRENWPLMLESIRRLRVRHPRARFLVAAYQDSQCLWCRDQLRDDDAGLPVEFYVGRTSEIIEASRCAMMVSGSVSLEMMARSTPAAVIYRVGRLTHAIAKRVVRLDSITLPNLIAGRQIFPEFVSVGPAEPAIDFLTVSVDAMLGDQYYYRQTRGRLEDLRQSHARPGASRRAAELVCGRVTPSRSEHARPRRRAA